MSAECDGDPAFVIGVDHLQEFERSYGTIPARSVLLARTGWERFLGTPAYLGDGPAFPGFDEAAVAFALERQVVGGIDTPGIEPGSSRDLRLHRKTASAGVYHLEGLVRLELLPPSGATLFVGVPPLVGGSDVPVRVLAFLAG